MFKLNSILEFEGYKEYFFIINVNKMVYLYITACHVFQIQTLVVGSFGIVEALRVPGNVRTATQSPAHNTLTMLRQ